jgi:hypothetical protein
MNFRLTALFFGVVLALVAGLLILVLVDEDKDATATAEGLLAPLASAGVTEKQIDTVELVRTEPAEQKLVFSKVGEGKWELREPMTAKVDNFAVEGLIRDLFRAKPTRDPGLTDNLSVHGLDRPTYRVTLRAGADRSETVNVGLTTIGGDRAVTYVTTSAAPGRPLAVRRSDLSALFRDSARGQDGEAWKLARWLSDYRVRRLIAPDVRDPSEVESVKITTAGKELALRQTSPGEWKFDAPPGLGEADYEGDTEPRPNTAPFTGVRPLVNMLTAIQVASPDDYIDRPEDLAKYGLAPNDPGVIRVELKTKAGPPEVVYFGKPVEEGGKPAVPAKVYARLEGDSAVAKVPTDRLEGLRQTVLNPAELRNRDLLNPAKRGQIDAIDLTVGPDTVKLRKVVGGAGGPFAAAGEKWVLYGGPEPAEAKPSEVAALLTQLARPRAAREVLAAPNDAAFTGPETRAVVKVWYGGEEAPAKAEGDKLPPEPKLKGEPVELTFGKKEGDAVFVRKSSGGTKADLKVADTTLGLVTKGRLDLLDPKLKTFNTQQVNRLAFNRGAEPFELVKADAGGWTFAKPDARKDKPADPQAVSGLVGLLSGLFPERVVAENPSADELKKWGLDPAAPRMAVTVGLKDESPKDKEKEKEKDKDKAKPSELVYHFGNDTDDRQHVYAQQVGRPVAFLVRKAVFDRFATDELRDPTVYRLDQAKVRKLRVKGWREVLGSPTEYVMERKGAEWVGAGPAGFQPDPAKVNALLAALAAPRADKFVGVGDRPEYGVTEATNPDVMGFTIESDGQPTVTLVLGKPADGGKVYAASSAVPGEVFTLDAATIKRLTEKPASLQK